ncbi:cysteine-rich receptor-like protein kinase [Trifolium pratense]|uniref:Cysteine-rich receptor-like protein kinase n=1 Tax=Trifolium pratense TaxID=57577 RepID=A0A2K3N321_TRIPR|nr:cysteine-rich receptor-like protein kinase [Trifolium pratense]
MSYFLTLIPKFKFPQGLGDYRPISLISCWYKLLSKVLANRLGRVMDTLIPNTQSAFLKGRQLVEGVVVVNEVIDFAKKSGKECLILKVDFEKAYDSVDWGFLEYMLGRFGFSVKWRNWMKACVCVGNLSILVNGSPTEEIQIKRGLKQGAPLAPLLFLLVAEGLGGLMRKAVEINQFRPFLALKAVLRGFEMTSGLKMNFWKSCVMGVNVSDEFLGMASDFLNCRIGRTPFKYLGLPVGANPHADESVAGIGENSTCFSLGRAIKTKQNKTCWVKWEEICKPKKEGGLGIRDLRFVNVSLLAKWRWKLLSHDCELWKDIVISRYGSDVVGKKNLGEADITRLFGISTQQNEVIQNLGSVADGQWRWELQWRRNLFVWEEEQYNVLIELIAPFVPNDQHDKWMWLRNGMEGFTVNFAYLLVVSAYSNQRVCDPVEQFAFNNIWKCGSPSKVCAFSWQLLLNRIPSKDNLRKRRMLQEHQQVCALCNLKVETVLHLFLHCEIAAKVWYAITSWLGFIIILPNNFFSSLAVFLSCAKNKKEKAGLAMIWTAFMWVLWKIRNDCVFNNGVLNVGEVVEQVKVLSWKWFVGRVAKGPCLLYEWRWSPLECMPRG